MANMTFRIVPALLSMALAACSQSGDDANWVIYKCGPLHEGGGLRWAPDESESIQVFAASNDKIREWALEIRVSPDASHMKVRAPADPHYLGGDRIYRVIHNGRTQLTAVYGRDEPVELYTLLSGEKLVYSRHANWDVDALDHPTIGGYSGTYYADCEKTGPDESK